MQIKAYDQKCYRCGREGYAADEFLHPYHGLCGHCWANDWRSKPWQPASPKVAKLEDFSDDEIAKEFRRRAEIHRSNLAKLEKWSKR